MPFYKDLQGAVHCLDSTEFEHLLPAGCVPITDEEAAQLQTPNPSDDELALVARGQRNALLFGADYKVNTLEDAGGDASAWRAYRAALRNVPQQSGFPRSITWPTAPAA